MNSMTLLFLNCCQFRTLVIRLTHTMMNLRTCWALFLVAVLCQRAVGSEETVWAHVGGRRLQGLPARDRATHRPGEGSSQGWEQKELPPPLHASVWDLEQAQQPGLRGPCPIDRLLVAEAGPGLDGLLLTLQAGLTIGRLTRRTFIVPSLKELHRRQVALADILNVKQLKGFWHCFVERDALEHQTQLANGTAVAGAPPSRALLQIHRLLSADLREGTYLGWEAQRPGHTAQQFAAWATGDRAASRAHTILVRAHLAGQVCGGEGDLEEAFWRRVRPSPAVAKEVAAVQRQLLGQGPYAAVHAGRGLGGHCHRFASARCEPGPLQDAVHAMCDLNATTLAEAFASQGWASSSSVTSGGSRGSGNSYKALPGRVFLATEPWVAEQQFQPQGERLPWPGAATYSRPSAGTEPAKRSNIFGRRPKEMVQGLAGDVVYAPAVELFLMAEAEVAVGNLASRTAVIAANLRAAYLKGTVLAWPEPAQHTWPYWECGRYHYCEGEAEGEAEEASRRRRQQRGWEEWDENGAPSPKGRLSCYPAQAW